MRVGGEHWERCSETYPIHTTPPSITGTNQTLFNSKYQTGVLAALAELASLPASNISYSSDAAYLGPMPPPMAAPNSTNSSNPTNSTARRMLRQVAAGPATAPDQQPLDGTIAHYKLTTGDTGKVRKALEAALERYGQPFYDLLARNGVPLQPSVMIGGDLLLNAGGNKRLDVKVAPPAKAQPQTGVMGLSTGELAGVIISGVMAVILLGVLTYGMAMRTRRPSVNRIKSEDADPNTVGQLRARYSKNTSHLGPDINGKPGPPPITASGSMSKVRFTDGDDVARIRDNASPAVAAMAAVAPAAAAAGASRLRSFHLHDVLEGPDERDQDVYTGMQQEQYQQHQQQRFGQYLEEQQAASGYDGSPAVASPVAPMPAAIEAAAPAAAGEANTGGWSLFSRMGSMTRRTAPPEADAIAISSAAAAPLQQPPEAVMVGGRPAAGYSPPQEITALSSRDGDDASERSGTAAPRVVLPPPSPMSSVHAVRFGSGLDFTNTQRSNYSVLGSSMPGGRLLSADRVRQQAMQHGSPRSSNGGGSFTRPGGARLVTGGTGGFLTRAASMPASDTDSVGERFAADRSVHALQRYGSAAEEPMGGGFGRLYIQPADDQAAGEGYGSSPPEGAEALPGFGRQLQADFARRRIRRPDDA